MEISIPKLLEQLFAHAVSAAYPQHCLANHLPSDRRAPALVLGAGKAAAAMARVFEEHWQGPLRGLVITRYGHNEPCQHIQVIEAAHPIPDDVGQVATLELLNLLKNRRADEQVWVLLSGGGSSLMSLPADAVPLAEKQAINRTLLRSGAAINEINCVRKHLSAIKGGRLAQLTDGQITTLAISDVVGDDPAVIASGPTVPDPTTSAEALAILARYAIPISQPVQQWLENPLSETPKPGALPIGPYRLIATSLTALQAAANWAQKLGITPVVLGDRISVNATQHDFRVAGLTVLKALKNLATRRVNSHAQQSCLYSNQRPMCLFHLRQSRDDALIVRYQGSS